MAWVLVPVLYLFLVLGSLLVFSSFYRRRAAKKEIEAYFPSHPERDQYVSLIQKTDPPPNETLLKAALLRRAMTDVQRVLRIREDKPALQSLLQKGSVGDDLWNSLLAAEKEMEAELLEVMAEANSFVEGWGQVIFQSAGEMIQTEKMRAMLEATSKARAEKELKYGKRIRTKKIMSSHTETRTSSKPSAVEAPSPIPPETPSIVKSNGHAPLLSAGAESSSESEATNTTSPTSTPKSPSKTSNKKGKRRK